MELSPARIALEGGGIVTVIDTDHPFNNSSPWSCRFEPRDGSTWFNYGRFSFSAGTVQNETCLVCGVPEVLSEGPGILSISVDNKSFIPAGNITYFPLFDPAVGRRPYITESEGSVLVATDSSLLLPGLELSVSAALAVDGDENEEPLLVLPPTHVIAGRRHRLPFSFLNSHVPEACSGDLLITLILSAATPLLPHSVTTITKRRRFVRHDKPDISSFTSVDHERRGLIRDGLPFNGHGWYSGYFGVQGPEFWYREMARQAQHGLNWIVSDPLNGWTPPSITEFFDRAHAAGMGVWFNLDTTRVIDPRTNTTAEWAQFVSNVTLVKDHPALIGYYICDDCCSNEAKMKNLSKAYRALQRIDPFHVTSGALDCVDSFSFLDASGYLSLDVPMIENYGTQLSSHAHPGTISAGSSDAVGLDGVLRHYPATWTPMVNMPNPDVNKPPPPPPPPPPPGNVQDGQVQAAPAAPAVPAAPAGDGAGVAAAREQALSLQYMALVTADIGSTLAFVYDPALGKQRWEFAEQEDVFAAQMQELWPSVFRRPAPWCPPSSQCLGGDDVLEVDAVAMRCVSPFEAAAGAAGAASEAAQAIPDAVRAAGWIEEGAGLCVHVVAVNSWTAPLHVQLTLRLSYDVAEGTGTFMICIQ
jgi:hypothetical protein